MASGSHNKRTSVPNEHVRAGERFLGTTHKQNTLIEQHKAKIQSIKTADEGLEMLFNDITTCRVGVKQNLNAKIVETLDFSALAITQVRNLLKEESRRGPGQGEQSEVAERLIASINKTAAEVMAKKAEELLKQPQTTQSSQQENLHELGQLRSKIKFQSELIASMQQQLDKLTDERNQQSSEPIHQSSLAAEMQDLRKQVKTLQEAREKEPPDPEIGKLSAQVGALQSKVLRLETQKESYASQCAVQFPDNAQEDNYQPSIVPTVENATKPGGIGANRKTRKSVPYLARNLAPLSRHDVLRTVRLEPKTEGGVANLNDLKGAELNGITVETSPKVINNAIIFSVKGRKLDSLDSQWSAGVQLKYRTILPPPRNPALKVFGFFDKGLKPEELEVFEEEKMQEFRQLNEYMKTLPPDTDRSKIARVVRRKNDAHAVIDVDEGFYSTIMKNCADNGYVSLNFGILRHGAVPELSCSNCRACGSPAHTARFCTTSGKCDTKTHYMCTFCAKPHLKDVNCTRNQSEKKCISCVRAKRQNTQHTAYDRTCPSVKAALEIKARSTYYGS